MKKYFLVMVCFFGMLGAGQTETIRGRIECIDKNLQVSVTLPDRTELGPIPIEEGFFQIDLPLGVRSGVLIFHSYQTSIQEHFQDSQRPFDDHDYYQASYSFRIPQGQAHLTLDPLQLHTLQFKIQRSESVGAQTPGLSPGVPVQIALLKDGFKTSVSRIIPLEENFTFSYLVWPLATYSLAILNPDAPIASREIIRSQSIRLGKESSFREVRWEY